MAMMQYYSHSKRIDFFRSQGKEGSCWDFKQEWHTKIDELIKDIVCFANTVHDENCYIIFGISDALEVTGMTAPRRKQADIIEAISNLHFAGDNFPRISVEAIPYEGHTIDILTIFNNEQTPIYLKKQYGKMYAGCIYARIEDKNTPDFGNADIGEIEMLWKKRLGLTKSPLQYILDRMNNKIEWVEDGERFYNKYRPEYIIELEDDEYDPNRDEHYSYAMTNSHTAFGELRILYHQTVLRRYGIVSLDSGRLRVPCPEWGYLCHDKYGMNWQYTYKYYVRGSELMRIVRFLYDESNGEQRCAFRQLLEITILYETEEERLAFESYIENNQRVLHDKVEEENGFSHISTDEQTKTHEYVKRLRTGMALNKLLKEYRKSV